MLIVWQAAVEGGLVQEFTGAGRKNQMHKFCLQDYSENTNKRELHAITSLSTIMDVQTPVLFVISLK